PPANCNPGPIRSFAVNPKNPSATSLPPGVVNDFAAPAPPASTAPAPTGVFAAAPTGTVLVKPLIHGESITPVAPDIEPKPPEPYPNAPVPVAAGILPSPPAPAP
ncbi:hypothetical protein CMI37_22830, partial [Candidatus Pacearchaeota archaeon]|nr:hypothetical protein [Candidatus Pacearchaeota archaeon]